MIQILNLTKSFRSKGAPQYIVKDANLDIPERKCLGLLGRNGAGKSTLLKIITGTLLPESGDVKISGTISWPVGFAGSFHGALTGAQNTLFVARVYGIDTDELIDFVEDFTELGQNFHMPVRTYSSGMKSRLAFAVSMGIPFDTYIIDEVTSVGDAAFRQKSSAVIRERLKHSGAIVVSHSMGMLHELCDCGAVLEKGKLAYFPEISDAIAAHGANMKAKDHEK
jgi:capsular polysaccharide transport system ATP-binding protein